MEIKEIKHDLRMKNKKIEGTKTNKRIKKQTDKQNRRINKRKHNLMVIFLS